MVRRLNNFQRKFNIINNNQFGFEKRKHINNRLGNFANYINNCLSNKKNIDLYCSLILVKPLTLCHIINSFIFLKEMVLEVIPYYGLKTILSVVHID